MEQLTRINAAEVTLQQALKAMTDYFIRFAKSGKPKNQARSYVLFSRPGIGKTEGILAMGEALEKALKVPVKVRLYTLGDVQSIDLIGIPVPNGDKTTYITPPMFIDDEPEGTLYLIFFDEVTNIKDPQMKGSVMRLIKDHAYWTHTLPANAFVICAGNPEEMDGEYFSEFPPALNSRFRQFIVRESYLEWRKWAGENAVHPLVLTFLDKNPDYLYGEKADEVSVFATPRSWKYVSDYLNELDAVCEEYDLKECYADMAGDLGNALAQTFIDFCSKHLETLPDAKDVATGKVKLVPKGHDRKVRMVDSLIMFVKDKVMAGRESELNWDIIYRYINLMEPEFGALFYSKLMRTVKLRDKNRLLQCSAFRFFLQKNPGIKV